MFSFNYFFILKMLQDLIRSCLRIRPQDRIELGSVLGHAWLAASEQEADSLGSISPAVLISGTSHKSSSSTESV